MASPVEKSTGAAIFQNWRAAGETSRSFRAISRQVSFVFLRARVHRNESRAISLACDFKGDFTQVVFRVDFKATLFKLL